MGLGQQILVVGTTGSGKSTVSAVLARARGLRHIELDALNWEADWTPAETPVFRSRLQDALAASPDGWVVDGNYLTQVGDLVWAAADTVVFLDLPLPLVLLRLVRRTIRRSRTKEGLWEGNRERLSGLVTRDSLLLWALQTHHRNRRRYTERMRDPARADVQFVRLRTPARVRKFLAAAESGS